MQPTIGWIVLECAGVGEKCGGPQALPPRRDIAYFVHPETAEADAKAFAEYKNATAELKGKETPAPYRQFLESQSDPERHLAFAWDHNIFNTWIRWAVLEWGGSERVDIAYFVDPKIARDDAKVFSFLRDCQRNGSREEKKLVLA
ncbi:MAG: hypothetical protein SVX43_18590 [Cyanobacteriota bacterium]|nr:hypothetical protein [Cyanobacteriota bacterium]